MFYLVIGTFHTRCAHHRSQSKDIVARLEFAERYGKMRGFLHDNELIVIVYGSGIGAGSTNMLRLARIGEELIF